MAEITKMIEFTLATEKKNLENVCQNGWVRTCKMDELIKNSWRFIKMDARTMKNDWVTWGLLAQLGREAQLVKRAPSLIGDRLAGPSDGLDLHHPRWSLGDVYIYI
jgi:hypothetical protein